MGYRIVAETPSNPGSIFGDDLRPTSSVSVTAPPRWNFAGFCNYCGEQGCRTPECVTMYLNTWWAACEICGGVGGDGLGSSCLCTYGVVQVGSGRVGAVQPR